MKFFLLIPIAALIAFINIKPAAQPGQGLSGFVYRESGNQMPAPNRPLRKPKGILCQLYIYQQTTASETEGTPPLFTKVKARLIKIVSTDSTGHYSVNLPVGKYSVFIKDGEHFFANESDGKGILNPVEVAADKLTLKDWRLSSKAIY